MSKHSIDRARPRDRWNEAQVVPVWLLVLVCVLLVAVIGVGAYAVVQMANGSLPTADPTSPVAEWEAKAAERPKDVDVRLGLAYAYQEAGRYPEAVSNYDLVLDADPRNLGALYNKGVSLMELGETAQAENALRVVLEIAPQHALAAEALGQYYADEGRFKDVIAVVSRAAEENDEMSDLHALLGVAYEETGEKAKARAEYENALRVNPQLESAKEGLARLGGETK